MTTTHSINATVAVGFAPETNLEALVIAHPVATPAARRKKLVLGLLAVASCTAIVLCFKAAVTIISVLTALDAAYKSFCS